MPRFCANLSMLYGERGDLLDRFAPAAADGFEGVEYLFPYGFPAEALKERLERHGLVQVLHNLPAGDWAGGERGVACLPGAARASSKTAWGRPSPTRRRWAAARSTASPAWRPRAPTAGG